MKFVKTCLSVVAFLSLLILGSAAIVPAKAQAAIVAAHHVQMRHYQPVARLPLSSSCFDTMTSQGDDLYLADASNRQVDVLDFSSMTMKHPIGTNEFSGEAGCHQFDFSHMGPNNLLLDAEQRLWASDGNSTIKVFSRQGHVLAKIATGGQARVDSLAFARNKGVILAVNADDPYAFVSLIDVHSLHILSTVATPGAGQAVWDGTHQRFLLAETNGSTSGLAVFEVAHQSLQQTHFWPLPLSCQPAGVVLGAPEQVLVGCSNGGAFIISAKNGAIQAQIHSSAIDLVSYSAGRYALATYTGPTTPGAVLLVDSVGTIVQRIVTAPLSHAVFQTGSYLVVPETGVGLLVYRLSQRESQNMV